MVVVASEATHLRPGSIAHVLDGPAATPDLVSVLVVVEEDFPAGTQDFLDLKRDGAAKMMLRIRVSF